MTSTLVLFCNPYILAPWFICPSFSRGSLVTPAAPLGSGSGSTIYLKVSFPSPLTWTCPRLLSLPHSDGNLVFYPEAYLVAPRCLLFPLVVNLRLSVFGIRRGGSFQNALESIQGVVSGSRLDVDLLLSHSSFALLLSINPFPLP